MSDAPASHSFPPVDEQLALLKRGVVDLVEEGELRERLESSRKTGRPLRVKLGIDPSSPDIHLGHTVVLRKLRDFQRLGHTVVVLWGTATAMVGDPTGKDKTRPQLTREQVEENKKTYKDQIGRVLDLDRIEERENGEWFDRMSFLDAVALAGGTTVARMLERDSFAKRYQAGQPISLHELVYPLMQGWDSVELKADVELGGTDQLFNLHMGRELQKRQGQPAQICMTMPLLVGLDGVQKMSKSLGNAIGVTDTGTQMFGKSMSLPDEPMRSWMELVTDLSAARIDELLGGHPRDAKVALAHAVVEGYHDRAAADAAVEEFERMFKQGGLPDDIPEVTVEAGDGGALMIAALLAQAGMCQTNSEGRRLVQGGGVKVDDVKIDDPKQAFGAGTYLVQAGKKKFARVTVVG